MTPLRLGAVSYLNTKPLVYGLEAVPDQFYVRFDVPSQCAALLHKGEVDLGLIPAIEYLRGDYAIVPGISIASDGPVMSVAVFTRTPIEDVRTLALDASSRTSVALTRILCAKRWGIKPSFVETQPNLDAMLKTSDAALVIGDPAFDVDPAKAGVTKLDLGEEWRAMTGLPFVYAMWTGRPGAATKWQVQRLQQARDEGVANLPAIAKIEGGGNAVREARALGYLRDNLKYGFGDHESAGLQRFLKLGVEVGVMPVHKPLRFYE